MSGGSAGTGRRGGNSATDEEPDEIGGSWEYFRQRTDRIYLWGQTPPGSNVGLTATNLSTVAPNGADQLRAYPHIFPRAGTIGRIGWFNPLVYAGGGGALRFGIYSDAGGVPDTLLFASSEFTSWPDPAGAPTQRWRRNDAALAVEAMSVLWLAWLYNDALRVAVQQVYTWNSNEAAGLHGYFDPEVVETGDSAGAGPRIPGSASAQLGWRAAYPYAALPTTFPNAATRRATAMNNATLEPSTLDGRVFAAAFKWTPSA